MKNKKQLRQRKTIQNAIAHLQGYAATIKGLTGYEPVAVKICIEDLERVECEL